ncbi:retrovirus-related pol polyprotein from transposon TNT 1-94 [Tanacetum coccineum]
MKDKVVQNTSQVKFKKTELEDHHRISSISNKTKSVIACNDSLKSIILNVKALCTTCGKCVFNSNHDACVSIFLNDINARSKKPQAVPIRPRKPIRRANQSVATPPKKTITSDFNIQKSKSYYRMLYEKTNKAWKWWIEKQCPSGYKWVPKTKMKWMLKVRKENIVQLILFIVDSGCTKHMTGNLKLLCNFVENIWFQTWFQMDSPPADIKCSVITTSYGFYSVLDTINLLSKKDIVNGLLKLKYVKDQLCSSCELSKAKQSTFKTKTVPSSKGRLNLLYMDLCCPMRIESINGKKYILVIVDDYSRYTWTLFLRTKDETPEVLKDFLKMIQHNLQA